jgi:hypothetical protein
MDVNWLAVLLAAVVGYFPGAIWYSPLMFLKPWAREQGIDLTRPPKAKHAGSRIVIGLIPSFAAATVFALILGPAPGLHHALMMAVAVAGGLVAPCFAIQYLYENRGFAFFAINAGYHLVQFLIFAVVLGLWH